MLALSLLLGVEWYSVVPLHDSRRIEKMTWLIWFGGNTNQMTVVSPGRRSRASVPHRTYGFEVRTQEPPELTPASWINGWMKKRENQPMFNLYVVRQF